MSFQYAPSQFRLPAIPNWTPPNGFWCGIDKDAGYVAFACSGWGSYVMTKGSLCYSLKIGGSVLKPVFSSVNGYIYWEGNGYVYFTYTYGWVWCNVFPGYEPLEESDYDSDRREWRYSGDSFYTISSLPYSESSERTMYGRGTRYGQTQTLTAVWDRWTSSREFGKYEAKGDASGEKYLGLPRFRGNGEYFTRSFEKEKGHYRYGRIHYADGKWLIGELDSDAGWHEGEEPSKTGSVNFVFTRKEGSEASGKDITVSLYDYVKGDERHTAFLGEAAIWR